MNPRKLTSLAVALVVISVTAAVLWRRRPPPAALPASATYAHLPATFNELLASAHRAASARPVDPAAVRRLARLYQANLLPAETQACYAWLAGPGGGLIAEDHRLLAELALDAGDLSRAVTELRATLTAAPDYLPARLVLAEALFKSGDTTAAAIEYNAALARTPDQSEALLGLARIALQNGDDVGAVARLERLLAVHGGYVAGSALLSQIMRRRGDAGRAAALAERSRGERAPVSVDPWRDALWDDCYEVQRLALRCEELMYAGQFEASAPLLARLETLDPGNWLPHLLKGWTANRTRHPDEALAEFRLALKKGGDPERILPALSATLEGLGRADEAEEEVNRALQSHPGSVALLTLQCDLVLRRGGDVRPLLVALLQKEPYLYKPNMDLAKILWTQGDRAGAVVCLARVTKAFPVDLASRGLLGQFYLENQDPLAAIPPLEQALPQAEDGSAAREKLAAMLASAYLRAGTGRHAAGDVTAATDFYAKAAALAPAGLEALAALAGEAVQAKRFAAATTVLDRMAALQPDNPTIQISLGDVLYQSGDPIAARPHWEQALKLAASSDAALRHALEARLHGPVTPDLFN